jgi:hypothetical protein
MKSNVRCRWLIEVVSLLVTLVPRVSSSAQHWWFYAPWSGQRYPTTSNIAAGGYTDINNCAFVLECNKGLNTEQSASGTASGLYWSATLTAPPWSLDGGFPEHHVRVLGGGSGPDYSTAVEVETI